MSGGLERRLAAAPVAGFARTGRRFLGALLSALLLYGGSPGVAGRDGSTGLAVLGCAVWAATVVQPLGERRGRARLAEWLGGAIGGGLFMWWVGYVVWGGVLFIAAGWGVYQLGAGALLRRLAHRLPLPLAAGIAWTGVETLRAWVLPPFGLGWLRLGHFAHAHLWLSGSARVLGVEGLSFVLAALGGGLAALALERRSRIGTVVGSLAPLFFAALLSRAVPPPHTVAGCQVLLVQPGFEQARKQYGDPDRNFADSCALTLEALEDLKKRGQPPVDLVCWGESMLNVPLFRAGVEDAVQAGAQLPSWEEPIAVSRIADLRAAEESWLRRGLLGLLPAGTSFCAGAETYEVLGGAIRRRVGLVQYRPDKTRAEPAFKRRLVPLGETMYGFERFGWVRALARSAAGYIPDFVPGEETGVLEHSTRDGRRYRFSATVCFDNAFPEVYVDAVRSGPLDFHLVASNEAWFRESCEMDQMLAFSRLIVLATGRSMVRATNSGVSLVLGPDGVELGRIEVGGKDRSVRGAGAWTVPVPGPDVPATTPYARIFPLWRPGWVSLALLAGLFRRRPSYRQTGDG